MVLYHYSVFQARCTIRGNSGIHAKGIYQKGLLFIIYYIELQKIMTVAFQ